MKPQQVLHKPTSPPKAGEQRWHIVLRGHPEELLAVLSLIADYEHEVIQTAEWTDEHELTICLQWIDDGIAHLVTYDIQSVSNLIDIKQNGRAICHGHNIET